VRLLHNSADPSANDIDNKEWPFQDSQAALSDAHSSTQPIALVTEGTKLQDSRGYERSSEYSSPPIGRRLTLLFGGIFGGLLFGLWGIVHLDDKRRIYGATAIGLSILLFVSGLVLWWLNLFPGTWGWWL
jgi:hypothetical protein